MNDRMCAGLGIFGAVLLVGGGGPPMSEDEISTTSLNNKSFLHNIDL